MYKVLKMTGFVYSRRKRDSALIGRTDIVRWRQQYLQKIAEFRRAGKKLVYLDETWVNAGHHKKSVWQDSNIKSSRQAFLEGLTTGPTAPTGKGSRIIITHAGTEEGFVDGALDVFEAKKGRGDYHEEMDGNHFEQWLTTKLLPNIQPSSVIVLDNAPYHSVQLERIPNKSTRKADIQNWLTSKGVAWTANMTIKKGLLPLVDSVRHEHEGYTVDKIVENDGHSVLRLPPYHCELNPIELIWAQVKEHVAKNKTFKMKDARQLLDDGRSLVTPASWTKAVEHTIKEEKRMNQLDDLITQEIAPLIINMDDDSSDDEFDSQEYDLSSIEVMDHSEIYYSKL